MLLSIVVLSYNRPKQIERILKCLIGVKSLDFNLIIKDDFSPRRNEIADVVNRYSGTLKFDVRLHINDENIGYDRNLIDAFDITEAEHVFLLSDDDYINGEELPLLLNSLAQREYAFYFTPYTDGCQVKRIVKDAYNFSRFADIIYNSVLFSGLVFNRMAVKNTYNNYQFLSDCIYSQVFLAASIIYKNQNYGVLPPNVLILGGDGENFFGKNDSAKNSHLLADRKKITADLTYQVFLLRVVDEISLRVNSDIKSKFIKEYKKRLISYGFKARSFGLATYSNFLNQYFRSNEQFMLFPSLFFVIIIFMPPYFTKKIYGLGVKFLRKSG